MSGASPSTGAGRSHRCGPPLRRNSRTQLRRLGPQARSWELYSARDDGSAPVQITSGGFQNLQPSWSPTGASIAFVRIVGSEREIYVVHPDGTELHRVVEVYGNAAGEPAWSPDGSRISYTNAVNGSPSRYGTGQEVFLVDADGSDERRLTELGPQFAYDSAPTWSPDGDQIVFKRGGVNGRLLTMNRDGTCESALGAANVWESPSWQALPGGPTVGPKTCRAVALEATTVVYTNRSAVALSGTVSNEGTQALSNVVVTITPTQNDISLQPAGGTNARGAVQASPVVSSGSTEARLGTWLSLARPGAWGVTSAAGTFSSVRG